MIAWMTQEKGEKEKKMKREGKKSEVGWKSNIKNLMEGVQRKDADREQRERRGRV